MKLVMTLVVRDEADIIDENIRYHIAQGVDYVIAMDHRSEDGTSEILRRHERAGHLRYLRETSEDFLQGKWVTQLARLAVVDHEAYWVINSDADEFWWPRHGSLKSAIGALDLRVEFFVAPRFNFIPRPESLGSLFARMIIREVESRNALGGWLPGKVCHRGHPEIVVSSGNHSVRGPALTGLVGESPLEVLHFPMRTYAQFARKIEAGGRALLSLPNREVGATWRFLFDLLRQGRLHDFYGEHELSESQIADDITRGELVVDDRLRAAFEAFGICSSDAG